MPELTPGPLLRRAVGAGAALLLAMTAAAAAQDRPTVVTVNYALSYFAERLGGGAVDVVFPTPKGVDPAFWRPGVADISAIQNADLIVLNGADFAAWTTKASLPRARTVDTARGFRDRFIVTPTVTHSHGPDGEHVHAGTASFTWLDQDLAILQARAIADALVRRGLAAPDAIETRLEALTRDLLAIDAAAERLRPLAAGKVVIATHPRYQYLARAYGLEIQSLEWEAGAAPDAGRRAALAALIDRTGAQVLLWEAAPPDTARASIREMGLRDVVFPTLATTPAGSDYVARFRLAVDDLAKALEAVDR